MKAATVSVGVNFGFMGVIYEDDDKTIWTGPTRPFEASALADAEEKIEEYEEDDDGSFTRMSSEDVVFIKPCGCGHFWGTSDWGEAPTCDRCGNSHPWSNVEGWNPEGN